MMTKINPRLDPNGNVFDPKIDSLELNIVDPEANTVCYATLRPAWFIGEVDLPSKYHRGLFYMWEDDTGHVIGVSVKEIVWWEETNKWITSEPTLLADAKLD